MSAINPDSIEKNSTTNAFLSSLAVNAALLATEVGAFIVLKQKLWRIYTPRTILPPPNKRSPVLPQGLWRWIPALIRSPSEDILHKNGLDAYMFLRFIRLLILVFAIFTITTFLIIVPANSVNIESAKAGLERISWTNITSSANQNRFALHVVTVYLLTGFVVYMIRREMLHFLHMRHQFLISKSHSRLAQARTVLITPIPQELANERDLRTFACFVPGGIDKVWMYRDTKILNNLFERRLDCCHKLEVAEASILKTATLAWEKQRKAYKKTQMRKLKDAEHSDILCELELPPANQKLLNDLVPAGLRPKHRTGYLGVVGPKVDTINWCKDQIALLNAEIKTARDQVGERKFLGSAFIQCNTQLGAHVLSQCLSYHEPMWMYKKWLEVNPKDVIWSNLDDGALEMKTRYALSWVAMIGLIIIWAFPVSFIGSLSNLSGLCADVRWLEWVCEAPPIARGLLEGVLPPLLLAVLFTLLPTVLRALAWYECIPRWSMISVSVYRRYYMFLVIHGFLIVTLTSGITNVIEEIIANPAQTVQHLSSQLPGAAIFFLTYMATQGLAGAGTAILQLVPLGLHYLRKWFLGRTPRQAYDVTFKMPAADFGVLLPRLSLLSTIAFSYSVLSPLINLLALISYMMFYVAWKFLFMQVFDQPDDKETGGMYFPMALHNLFVGLYIEQICLACLFFLNVSPAGSPALIEACFMVVLIALTACAQLYISSGFDPLKKYLPMSLATNKMVKRYNRSKKGDGEVTVEGEKEDIDLFSKDQIQRVRRRIKATARRIDQKIDKKLDALNKGTDDGHGDGDDKPNGADHTRLNSDDTVLSGSRDSSKQGAQPKSIPKIESAAPAEQNSDSSDDEEDVSDHAFDHPSTYVDQPWIWMPKDSLGLSDILVDDLKEAGVDASNVGATMDDKGVVEVSRSPPDEEWSGGHDL